MRKRLELIRKHKKWIGIALSLWVLGTVAAGIYFKHFLAVGIFAAWMVTELLFLRFKRLLLLVPDRGLALKLSRPLGSANPFFTSLIEMFHSDDPGDESRIDERLSDMRRETGWTAEEVRWIESFHDLVRFRKLLWVRVASPRDVLKSFFVLRVGSSAQSSSLEDPDWNAEDIQEAALAVAHLYQRLFNLCSTKQWGLGKAARGLLEESLGKLGDDMLAPAFEAMSDGLQRQGGLTFLLLNLLSENRIEEARSLGKWILAENGDLEEEVRSQLYWMAELSWFQSTKQASILDHESTIRYLYHLCFLQPDRAGFLEIDSQFFSQFDTVSEIAQEGLLFKETLVEGLLELWQPYEGVFDPVFQTLFESLTQRKSKVYDERGAWEGFWRREKEGFGRDYLCVVEGNVCFAGKHYLDAKLFYEKALKINPNLRSARLNLLFALAALKETEKHEEWTQKILNDRDLYPSCLYVIGNSFLLMGEDENSEVFYEALAEVEGWENRIDFYRSTFCFEHGLFEKALLYARRAAQVMPGDTSLSYHLSLCYNAVGEKDSALEMVEKVPNRPEWIDYYKFTLERDSGHHDKASQTLLRLSSEYFADSEELDEAIDYARNRRDFVLLRHLRQHRAGNEN